MLTIRADFRVRLSLKCVSVRGLLGAPMTRQGGVCGNRFPMKCALQIRGGPTVSGFCHFDTKTSNWIIQADPVLGPVPVMVDVDGIRPYRWNGEGMRRLRLSLEEQPEFNAADRAALELGFNPWAKTAGKS